MATTLIDQISEDIVETIHEPLLVLDSDLKVILANRSFIDSFKVTRKETLGRFIYDIGNKQWDIPNLRELLETILPGKISFDNYEVVHDFDTIGRRVMLLNARQIKRVWGKERIILLAIEDITKRRQWETFLADSEKRYKRLFENANDGILLLEKCEGTITHANPAITSMLGYTNEEFIGHDVKEIGFPDDMGTIEEILQTLAQDGIIHHKGAAIKKKDGQFVDTDIYLVDKADLIQCNIRDVTDRKKVERSLKESEENYRFLFDNAPDLIISCNTEGTFLDVNKKFEEESGYGREEMIGKNVFTSGILAESSVNESIPSFEKILAGKERVLFEVEGVTKDGSKIPYELLVSCLINFIRNFGNFKFNKNHCI
jgi:PAS domain S-box-containing protein